MKGRFEVPSLLFYGMSCLMAVVCTVCFINALSWVNKPFPGFLMYKLPRVASMNISEWPGVKAGLKLMDRIITVDDKPIRGGKDVVITAREKSPGTPLRYTIESEGKIREVVVPTGIFSLYDFLLVFLTPFVGGIVLFCLGFAVYMLKPNVSTSWVFFLACFFESMYMITGFEIMSTYSLVYIHYAIVPVMMAPLFHFGLIFPEKKALLIRYPLLEYLIYLPAVILTIAFELSLLTSTQVLASEGLGRLFDIKVTTALTRAFTLLCVAGMIVLVIHSLVRTSSSMVRQRARMILFGVTLAFFPPGMIMALVYFIKAHFPWNFLAFFVLIYPAAIAYSIVRHNLFDADAIIKRTVGYAVLTAFIVGAYLLVSVSFNVFLAKFQIAQSRAFPIVFTLAIILIFNPLRNRVQSLVDRIFFRKEYDYGEIIDKIGNAITSSLDLGHILRQIIKTFSDDMFIDTSSVVLLNPAKTEYQVYLADGERKREVEEIVLDRNKPLMQAIEKEKKELTKYDVLEDPKYRDICEDCSRDFETLRASLVVPLVFQDEVTGLISLGEKKSGKFYNRQDVELLCTLANQGAVAIENARLHQARIDALEQSKKELEQLNRAKSKALDHLSHELRTPLSVIQGNIRILKRRLQTQASSSEGEKFFETMEKQLNRLVDIQQETDKIIRSYQEIERKPIFLFSFAEQTLERAKGSATHRDLHFQLDGARDLCVFIPQGILEEVLEGLLKNAVENTPDEGMIRILLEQKDGRILLKVQDFGVGITEENQRQIFDGLFHTQETDLYTSKKPYDFGAGGKGLDLLRMKVYGQRFGFDLSLESRRCGHIPTDWDLCPGKISACPYCKIRENCLNSGGSTFCLSFPVSDG